MPQVRFDDYPAGDAYARPSDMARFLGMLLNGGKFETNQVLSQDAVSAIQKPQVSVGPSHGLGVFLVERGGRR